MQQYRQDVSDIINCLQLFLLYDETEFFRKAERIIIKIMDELKFSLK